MLVSINWLKELVNLNIPVKDLVAMLPLRTIGTKEVTDQSIELDMKGYNRSDLLSMRGVAYEVSALTSSNIYFSETEGNDFVWNSKDRLPEIKVTIENSKLSPFYCVAKIENIKVTKSSEEWVARLKECGVRSVNNIADITNLVMFEYGQPLHAFDADKVEGEIRVRVGKNNEKIVTLDDKERLLTETDLVIADEKKALAIAGVMGGKNSEISNSTSTLLLEAAIFDPVNTRRTTTSLGLPSEASKRFQHGLTKKRLLQALDAAIKMYEVLGGRLTAITIKGDFEDKVKKVPLTLSKVNSLIGSKFTADQVADYLTKLCFKLNPINGGWEVTPPYFRLDVNLEEDLIEEVARMYGYEKIPPEPVAQLDSLQAETAIFKMISNLRAKLIELGLSEVQTYSFYSSEIINVLNFDKSKLVQIANPISAETENLRDNIWPNLVEVVNRNLRHKFSDIAVFEIGKAYFKKGDAIEEEYRLAIAISDKNNNPAKELIAIAQELGTEISTHLNFDPAFHPKRTALLKKDGGEVGKIGEIHLRVLDNLGITQRVAILEMKLIS